MEPMPRASRLTRWLSAVLLIVVILYTAFILWPAYSSGLAAFTGDPKWEWDRPVPLWYAPAPQPNFTPWTVPLLVFVICLGLFAPLVIGVASVVLFSLNISRWPALKTAERARALLVSGGCWVFLVTTYVASSQFMRWVFD